MHSAVRNYRDAVEALTTTEIITLVHSRLNTLTARQLYDDAIKDKSRKQVLDESANRLAHVEVAKKIADTMRPQPYVPEPPAWQDASPSSPTILAPEPETIIPPPPQAPSSHIVRRDVYADGTSPTERRLEAVKQRPPQLVNDARLTARPRCEAGRYALWTIR